MSGATAVSWLDLVPFSAGQAVAVEVRKFVFSIRGDGRVTELSEETLGLHMHVPAQMGVDETALELVLTWSGAEAGNAIRFDTTRKDRTRRVEHDDVRMTALPDGKVRIERAATRTDEKDMAFTVGRAPAGLVIGDVAGLGQLDGATITLRAD